MTQRDDRLRPLSGNESLFDDPMLPSDSSSMNGATTGTGAMATPVGSGSTLAGIDDPTGEQAFRSSLAAVASGSGASQGSGSMSSGGASSGGGQSDDSGGSSLPIPDPGEAVSAVKSGGSHAMSQANGWIKEHPLVAVGLGLVGGIILGSRGGGEHHHHYGSHGDQGGNSYQGGSQGQSGGGLGGGLMHLAQQSGLLDNLSGAADRALQIANEQVSGVVRQYVPDFDQHLEEKRSSTSQGAGQIRSGAAGPTTRS
ncbi:MAG TPA: hypothetical protein VGT61_01135 [Thermomicrobiales bacterium]|jgi:hypothetical protein|nr:hypothetical protein [Thermomicrobiales bacterium]